MQCRDHCGACCIAPSISSPLPGMPGGKPAGVRCAHLLADLRCGLWGLPERPQVCQQFQPEIGICGTSREQALVILTDLEGAVTAGA
ncbi:MAG: YkgJ family cysteine cluster protein [Pseudomonadota bacterium]